MSYEAQIIRANLSGFLFLIDQSASVNEARESADRRCAFR